ncbi:hypothetical protein [Lysobacter gummosus]|uniref:hypothetical protein n=1 Tax=Lysobacter gummosus TaxID=262324 RepID=UPI003637AE1A
MMAIILAFGASRKGAPDTVADRQAAWPLRTNGLSRLAEEWAQLAQESASSAQGKPGPRPP